MVSANCGFCQLWFLLIVISVNCVIFVFAVEMGEVSVVPQTQNHGTEFEHLHVRSVYDEIAPCMNDIEHKAWPNVKRFLKKLPAGAVIADIGTPSLLSSEPLYTTPPRNSKMYNLERVPI